MVDVTTNEPNAGEQRTWGAPITLQEGSFGEILYLGQFVIPSKLAADENRAIITLTLPVNFWHRIMSMEVSVASEGLAVMDDFEPAMNVLVTEDGTVRRRFALFNTSVIQTADEAAGGFAVVFTSTTQDFSSLFEPVYTDVSQDLINAARGLTTITITFMDTSGDTTTAVTVDYRVRTLTYTIEQALNWSVNSPLLVTS